MLLCVGCPASTGPFHQDFVSPVDFDPFSIRALDAFGQVRLIPEHPAGAGLLACFSSVRGCRARLRGMREVMAGGWFHGGRAVCLTKQGGGFSSGGVALNPESEFPDEGGELAGDGDLDLVVMHEALAHSREAGVEAVLGFPGKLDDPARLALLAFG